MKSRTILKYQYDDLGNFLCEEYVKKNKLKEKKAKVEEDIRIIMANDLPDLVKEAYTKYPEYFNIRKLVLQNILVLLEPNNLQYEYLANKSMAMYEKAKKNHDNKYDKEIIDFANDLYKTLDEKKLLTYNFSNSGYSYSYWGYGARTQVYSITIEGFEMPSKESYDSIKDKNVIGKCIRNHPKIAEILKAYAIEVAKYTKFRKDISCAFSTITTTNMLKNEIPEAYEFFYNKWGAEYEKQDAYNIERKKGEKKAQCDKIEELRASIQ